MSADDHNSLQIRYMQPEDCSVVAQLQAELDQSHWNQSQWLQALEEYPTAWVVTHNDGIIGYIIYQAKVDEAELLNLGIARQFQSRGLAARLIGLTLGLLPKSATHVYLEVRRSNIPAIALYEKIGFNKVGERPGYYLFGGGSREDAFVYKYVM